MAKFSIISGLSSTPWRILHPSRKQKTIWIITLALATTLLLFCVATFAKWFIDNKWNYKYRYNPRFPCGSLREATGSGLLTGEVKWNPKVINVNGVLLQIGESWIEREVERNYVLVWFQRYKETGNYHFCFRLKSGHELFGRGWPTPEFVLNNNAIALYSHYFTSIEGSNDILFYITINTNMLSGEAIILCLPDPIACQPDARPLAQFEVTRE